MKELCSEGKVSREDIARHLKFVEDLGQEMLSKLGLAGEQSTTCLPVLFQNLMTHYKVDSYKYMVNCVGANGVRLPANLSNLDDENRENYALRFIFGNESRELNLYFQEKGGMFCFEVNGPVNGKNSQVGSLVTVKTLDSIFGRLSNEIGIIQSSERDLRARMTSY